ncbi:hypothetical protein [Pleomorphomonas sp. PLEO]|uniref:hypothetical protein n=1 Tax=Pleomorphomonas sp. PLEO TaxID=3239306 RepID=UPI00351DE0E5
MKYLSAIAGAVLLMYMLSLQKVEVFGVTCRIIGSQKATSFGISTQEPTCLNDGAFTMGIALGLALLVIGGLFIAKDILSSGETSSSAGSSGRQYNLSSAAADEDTYSSPKVPAAPVETARFDKKKWQTLKQVDPEIAAASAEICEMSPALDDTLAEKYLVLNDKTYLKALVTSIKTENVARIEAERLAKENALAAMSEKQKALLETRTVRSLAMIEDIKKNGMYNIITRKKVASMEMYYGEDTSMHGYVKIINEDGTAELRSGNNFSYIQSDAK